MFEKDLKKENKLVSGKKLEQIKLGSDKMNDTIVSALGEGGAPEEVEIWRLHKHHIDAVYENGGTAQGKRVPVHPTLLSWAIAFLARTSVSTYNKVRKVMKLPHISYVHKKTAELVSATRDKGYAINIETIRTLGKQAVKQK